ncbi:MAG TPA: hypothetical protein VLD64_00015 [Nitrosarchaeum sp.]|nr:hypothetical protein [Nitrosarchaeum sp.]
MTSKYVASLLLASVLLMSVAAISVQSADAMKASGTHNLTTNNKNVCGDKLCSVAGANQMMKEKMAEKAMVGKTSYNKMTQRVVSADNVWKTKTGTAKSTQDPGLGHESHQLAIILAPSSTIYKGILTYDASENIQLVALHGPLAPGEDTGQAIWTPDGKTKFALTFVDPGNSAGSWIFSGNALAVHTKKTDPFTVSYSVSYMENQPSETVKTGTAKSIQDPGLGHESHQLAIILPPSDKTYTGVLTYDASENIQLVALHGPLAPGEDTGQAIWTPDGKTKFALTFVDPGNSAGSWIFSGNALAVHTKKTDPFTVSYSVVAGQ